MAPPILTNNLDLYTIGYVTLKYPELAPGLPVPLGNIVGALQYQPMAAQAQQVSDETTLNDKTSPQYYLSNPALLLNFLTTSPDVCKRIAAHASLTNTLIEKILAPDFHDGMRDVVRPALGSFPPAGFAEDFGSILQFLSTLLLYQAEMESVHPRLKELIPKLKEWKKQYKNSHVKTIRNVCERMIVQINGMDPEMCTMMRKFQEDALSCGVASCRVRGAASLTVCGTCKIQRYCGRDHQKADWKYHKHICNKGLVEPTQ
ncbi:uncharacterized protein RCO7_06858 [Rhynchosporium graminicola]|uniref:MYND-type domain-containing protein n=1 Tax=Rhynchosporium graminicola TaxID=2792576 RepID=A0A1E1JXL0_9HELO|nr:uncharacterized protein RCO7_06858 [Rhynchosporium commune]